MGIGTPAGFSVTASGAGVDDDGTAGDCFEFDSVGAAAGLLV